MTNISEHFTLKEMTRSSTGLPNIPGPAELAALTLLCERVLEPLRAHYGKPVRVTSGYRSLAVNTKVGGAKSSQHRKGEAADFTVEGVSNWEVANWLKDNLDYDQLIYEFGEGGWLHCSYSATRMRNEELSAKRVGRSVKYLPGLVL